jgi:hypothetical protein
MTDDRRVATIDAPAAATTDGLRGRLAALTPTGRASVPVGWALYDFANTIYSYAIVSYAIGLWAVDRLGRRRPVLGPAGGRRQRARQRARLAGPRAR